MSQITNVILEQITKFECTTGKRPDCVYLGLSEVYSLGEYIYKLTGSFPGKKLELGGLKIYQVWNFSHLGIGIKI